MPEQSDKFISHPDDAKRAQYFDAALPTPTDSSDILYKRKSTNTVNVLGAKEDIATISEKSTLDQKDNYFDQARTAAFMTDVLFEAQLLRESSDVPDSVKNEISELMKASVWSVQKLQARLMELKTQTTSSGKTYEQVIREKVASKTAVRNAETKGESELESKARAYVEEFLRQRIQENPSTSRLEIRYYSFVPDAGGNAALDQENIELATTRANVDYAPSTAVHQVFQSIEVIQKGFSPILQREVTEFLKTTKFTDEKLEKTKVEAHCVDVISDILYALNRSGEDNSSVFSRVNANMVDPRGALLGIALREQLGTSRRKAERLRLPNSAYLDPKEVRIDSVTPTLIEDVNHLLEAAGVNSRVSLETAYPPIDAQILQGLEMFVDETGITKELLNPDEVVRQLMSKDSGIPSRLTQLTDLGNWDKVTEHQMKLKDLENAEFDLKTLYTEIKTFLSELKKPVNKLDEIVEERGLFGGGIKNQDVITRRDEYKAKQKTLEEKIARLKTETSQKPPEPYSSRQILRDQLRERLTYYEEVGFELPVPALAEKTASAREIPNIRVKLGKNALKGFEIDPLQTFEARLQARIQVIVTEVVTQFDTNIKTILAKLTADFARTRGVMDRVTEAPTAKQITRDILAYALGGIYNTNDGLSLDWEQEAFFYAAKEHTRSPSMGADFIVPDRIKPKFEALKLLKT